MKSSHNVKKQQSSMTKQLRQELSTLANENEMLQRKMELIEENAALKQSAVITSFLSWMDRRESSGKPSKELDDPQEKERASPKKSPKVDSRNCSSNRDSFGGNADSFRGNVNLMAQNETKIAGSPDVTITKEIGWKKVTSRETEGRPVTSTYLKARPSDLKSFEDRCIHPAVSDTTSRHISSTPLRGEICQGVTDSRSVLDETRLAGSPDISCFSGRRVNSAMLNAADNCFKRVSSTPLKPKHSDRSVTKRVAFEDEILGRTDANLSSVPTTRSPGSTLTWDKKLKSASSAFKGDTPFTADHAANAAPKDGKYRVHDVHSPLRASDKRLKTNTTDGPSMFSSTSVDPSSGFYSKEQTGEGTCSSAKRTLHFDSSSHNRSHLDPNKFFSSRSPTHQERGSAYTSTSQRQSSTGNRARQPNPNSDVASSSLLSSEHLVGLNVDGLDLENENFKSTTDYLEMALQDIYRRNLEDELKITEIRRDALQRFAAWRDAVDIEMAKLEKFRKGPTENGEVNEVFVELNKTTDRDHSRRIPIVTSAVNISEGPLSQLEDTATRPTLRLEDLDETDLRKSTTNSRFYTANSILNITGEDNLGKSPVKSPIERRPGTTNPKSSSASSFMSSPETVIIGEVAFQLERTVLAMAFRGGSKQLTGYTLSNMEKMLHSHYDIGQRPALEMQLMEVRRDLNVCGWNQDYHPKVVADLIRTYGTFPSNAITQRFVRKHGWMEPRALKETVLWGIPKDQIHDTIVILDCLFYLTKKTNTPLFTW